MKRIVLRLCMTAIFVLAAILAQAQTDPRAQMISPIPGSTLPGSTVTFTWSPAAGGGDYFLQMASNPFGQDIFFAVVRVTSVTLINLPTNGGTIYVYLFTQIKGVWSQPFSYTYKAAGSGNPAPTTTTVDNKSVTFSATSQNVTLTAAVAAASAVNQGTVTFQVKDGVANVGSPVTSATLANGGASIAYALPGGTAAKSYTIQASYSGGTNFQASSGAGTLTVNAAAAMPTTTTVANASATFSAVSQNVTLTATVAAASAVNQGTVTFQVQDGAANVGSPVTSATLVSGSASVAYALPGGTAAKSYTIQASYSGGTDFQASSGTGTLTVNAASVTENVIAGLGQNGSDGGWMSVNGGASASFSPVSMLRLPWTTYNATGGGIHVATGDVDGDGLAEVVVGLGAGGAGWIAVLDDAAHNYALLKWIQVAWPSYNTTNGEVFPAVGDLDGDGKAEIVAGLGNGSQGWIEIFGNSSNNYQHLAWVQVAWPAYNAASGITHPAVADLNGDGKSEIILGLGNGGGGWLEVLKSAADNYAHSAWLQVQWPAYNATNGTTFPAAGDIDGDGRAEIVIGLGQGSAGWVEFLDDANAGYAHMRWFQIPYDAYNAANGEVHPAAGNVDSDTRAEIVFGLGRFQGNGGWLFAIDDAASGYAGLGWFQVPLAGFVTNGGETFPAIGRLR